MTRLIRGAGLVIIAAVLARCGSNAAGSPGPDSGLAAPIRDRGLRERGVSAFHDRYRPLANPFASSVSLLLTSSIAETVSVVDSGFMVD